ncbi:MAG: MDR family MFS transporter [Sphingomonadaceae bacterium]
MADTASTTNDAGGENKPAAQAAPIPDNDPGDDKAALPVENTALLIIGVMLASLLQVLDTTIANVALPHMQSALGATLDSVTWVLTSYIVASAVAMPATGWLSDRIGGRPLFIASVAGFILTSMLCGMAQNLTEMVIFRALQGVSGAFIAPLSQSFMLDATRPSRHPQMMAIWGMGVIIGPIIGPVLGGWLTESWNWRWVFYVNLPLGIISLILLIGNLPRRPLSPRKFDLSGFLMLAFALAALQLLLDRGQGEDWFASVEIWIYFLVVVSCGWMAVIHIATTKNPLFDRGLFADRNFFIALMFMLVIGVVMFANMALLPPMLQQLLGYSVIDTGLVMMPRGIGVMISMQLAGLLSRKGVDARILVGAGFAIMSFSMWQMAHWSLDVDSYHIVVSGLVQGLGLGLVFIPLNITAFATLPFYLRTDGSSLLNLHRSIGSSIGISIVTVLLARNIQQSHSDIVSHITQETGTGSFNLSMADQFQQLGDMALTVINAEVTRQASMVAYIDNFYLMMWMSLLAIPLVLFLSPAKTNGSPPPPVEGH